MNWRLLAVVGMGLGLMVGVVVVLSIGTVVYPGSFKWTAPLLCPDGQPDAYVIRTTTSDSDGSSTNFSLFCMGDRGDFTEVGSWRPLGVLFLYTFGGLLAGVATPFALGALRARFRRRTVTER